MRNQNVKLKAIAITFSIASLMMGDPAQAVDLELSIAIKNHTFDPSVLKVPANQRIKLTVQNLDNTAEEFESHALNREKVIPGGSKAVIYIGPLKPGRYEFLGEFNPATAKGVVVAE
jgi:hypothetical protein